MEAAFDAAPYFGQASDEDLLKLARCGWRNDYPADEVAQYIAERNPSVERLFTYLSFEPRSYGGRVGFECAVEEGSAIAWIKEHRPALLARLIAQELI